MTSQTDRVTPPSLEVCVPLPFAIGQDLVWLVSSQLRPTGVYPLPHIQLTVAVALPVLPTWSMKENLKLPLIWNVATTPPSLRATSPDRETM